MKKIFTPAFILFWIFMLINYAFFMTAGKQSSTPAQIIGASVYFGIINAVVVYFFIKSLIKEFEKEAKKEQ